MKKLKIKKIKLRRFRRKGKKKVPDQVEKEKIVIKMMVVDLDSTTNVSNEKVILYIPYKNGKKS